MMRLPIPALAAAGLSLGALVFISGSPARAQNATLTFEGQGNTIYESPIVRSGYQIGNPAAQEPHFHEIDSTQFGLPSNGTGVLLNDRDTQIFITAAPGSGFTTFTLAGVDVASALNNNPANGLTLTGFLNNVQTGIITVASLGSGYTTLSGAGLGTVDRLLFDGIGGGGGFVFDNVRLGAAVVGPNPVPEPSEWLAMGMAGTSVMGLMIRARRRKSATA